MVVLCAVLAGFVANYIPGISVKILLLQCLGFTFVYGLALYIFGLEKEERQTLIAFSKNILRSV